MRRMRFNNPVFWLLLILVSNGLLVVNSGSMPSSSEDLVNTAGNQNVTPLVTGVQKAAIILIEFSDVKHNNVVHPQSYFNNFLNGQFNPYWTTVSYNQISWTWNVTAWLTLPNTLAFYGAPPERYAQLLRNSISAADPTVNFNLFNYVFIVYAGQDEAISGNRNDIRSAAYYYNPRLRWYTMEGWKNLGISMVSEWSPLGIWAGDAGNMLDMPNMYNLTAAFRDPVSDWSLMANGRWLGNPQGTMPSYPSAWCLNRTGWISNIGNVGWGAAPKFGSFGVWQRETVAPSGNVTIAKVRISQSTYFFVEVVNNQTNYDSSLPDEGVLITFVNEADAATGRGQYDAGGGQTSRPPVRVVDRNPATASLADALWHTGDTFQNSTYSISIRIVAKMQTVSGIFYTIDVDTTAAVLLPDLYIIPWVTGFDFLGSRAWGSRDIWIDGPNNGYDRYVAPEEDIGNRDYMKVNAENRFYARIRNIGNGTATNINVVFSFSGTLVSAPGRGGWMTMGSKTIPSLLPSQVATVYITWKPPATMSHPCMRVDATLPSPQKESNTSNNGTQENITMRDTSTGSGWKPVAQNFTIVNPHVNDSAEAELFIEEVNGLLPDSWFLDFPPFNYPNGTVIPYPWAVALQPNGTQAVMLNITVPTDALPGTVLNISVTGIANSAPGAVNKTNVVIGFLGAFYVQICTKHTSTVSITMPKTQYLIGEALSITGSITPSHGGEPMGLYFIRQDGYVRVDEVDSQSNGTYSYWKPLDATWLGTWAVTTSWDGDADHSLAESIVAIFVVKAPTIGGPGFPVDKLALLAPYVGLASTIIAAAVGTIVYMKRKKKDRTTT